MDMHERVRAGMLEATRLVGAGSLIEATALIQRALRGMPVPDETPDVAPGGRFLSGSYSNHAGSRTYKLYIPSGYHGQTLPLVVMLHGCKQDPDDFAIGTRMNILAEEHQC